jgi:hypothetical protein
MVLVQNGSSKERTPCRTHRPRDTARLVHSGSPHILRLGLPLVVLFLPRFLRTRATSAADGRSADAPTAGAQDEFVTLARHAGLGRREAVLVSFWRRCECLKAEALGSDECTGSGFRMNSK